MNLKEAYTTLEIPEGSSEAEAKKKFRELSKKLHPDNKDTGDEAKFKKINQAYQRIRAGEDDPREAYAQGGYPGGFQRQWHTQVVELSNVDVGTVISFKEAVQGLKKEIKYNRQSKCQSCAGAGQIRTNNGCQKCGGRGQVVSKQTSGNQSFVSVATCTACYGKSTVTECTACKGDGLVHTDVSVHVSIPAGILDGTTLRLQGMGNYAGSVMGLMDQYTDAFLHVTVTPEPGLQIEGQSVVSHLSISLLDALRGCERSVKTILGQKTAMIKPGSRNKDEVIIPHCGVGGTGDQRVILDVQYPKNTDKLVGVLINEET
jgi:molecular chaperone DnaJ